MNGRVAARDSIPLVTVERGGLEGGGLLDPVVEVGSRHPFRSCDLPIPHRQDPYDSVGLRIRKRPQKH